MKKLLVVCGPTGVGKTKLALQLSKVLGGEIISADSRQVYKGLNIGTGKDIPQGAKYQLSNIYYQDQRIGFYQVKTTKIWGYDLLKPRQEFSVAGYLKIAEKIIKNIHSRKKLPILVGGSGLYIKGVVDGIDTVYVPRNLAIRKHLSGKSVEELFEILAHTDPMKAAAMNRSDKKNPRRIIRAIEVSIYKSNKQSKKVFNNQKKFDVLLVGLIADKELLNKIIKKRVVERIDQFIELEIEKLLRKGVSWNDQSMLSLGYRQFRSYYLGEKDINETISEWTKEEQKFAKRQITWFKKDKRINWFSIRQNDFEKSVENLVKKWYN